MSTSERIIFAILLLSAHTKARTTFLPLTSLAVRYGGRAAFELGDFPEIDVTIM